MGRPFTFPQVLYKAFSGEEHAKAFCQGKIRFSTLEYYRRTQDGARSDQTEGLGVVHVRSRNRQAGEAQRLAQPTVTGIEKLCVEAPEQQCFVCCFSMADKGEIDQLPARFGRFYVEVNAPERLFCELRQAIDKDPRLRPEPPELEAGAVRYDKGRYVGEIRDEDEIRSLPWLQKPAFYSEENEYRMHFRCPGMLGTANSHVIEVGRPLEYCQILRWERRPATHSRSASREKGSKLHGSNGSEEGR